jgi:hypothetical protein
MKALRNYLSWLVFTFTEVILSLVIVLLISHMVVISLTAISDEADRQIIEQNERPSAFAINNPFWQPVTRANERSEETAMRARRETPMRKL